MLLLPIGLEVVPAFICTCPPPHHSATCTSRRCLGILFHAVLQAQLEAVAMLQPVVRWLHAAGSMGAGTGVAARGTAGQRS